MEDFYCPDTGDAHKSTEKIQLSIICSDLIAMVTEQWKILIKPALATGRKMVDGEIEGRQKMRETEGGRRGREDNGTVFEYVCMSVCVFFYACF